MPFGCIPLKPTCSWQTTLLAYPRGHGTMRRAFWFLCEIWAGLPCPPPNEATRNLVCPCVSNSSQEGMHALTGRIRVGRFTPLFQTCLNHLLLKQTSFACPFFRAPYKSCQAFVPNLTPRHREGLSPGKVLCAMSFSGTPSACQTPPV